MLFSLSLRQHPVPLAILPQQFKSCGTRTVLRKMCRFQWNEVDLIHFSEKSIPHLLYTKQKCKMEGVKQVGVSLADGRQYPGVSWLGHVRSADRHLVLVKICSDHLASISGPARAVGRYPEKNKRDKNIKYTTQYSTSIQLHSAQGLPWPSVVSVSLVTLSTSPSKYLLSLPCVSLWCPQHPLVSPTSYMVDHLLLFST